MSNNIPFEIQQEILKRLPVKSLIQFRSVSKPWKSLIDSSAFIHNYQHTQLHHHIPIRDDFKKNYVSVADDDTFPNQKVSMLVPVSSKRLYYRILLGSSQGLFCLKSVDILVPDLLHTFVGFGVCPCSLDPILVNITLKYSSEGINSMTYTTWLAEVFKLSSGAWKSLSINLPRSTTALHDEDDQVVIDRGLYICKLKESFVVLQFDSEVDAPNNHVWMMEIDDKKSFTKIYTIMGNSLVSVFGSKKSGKPIIALKNQSEEED
nr:hypothetical protein [Tanacetum cinerariifolium]